MASVIPKVEPTTPQRLMSPFSLDQPMMTAPCGLQQPLSTPPLQHSSRAGKVPKPIMEKRRRARINKCLEELKSLVPDLNESGTRVDKADVLEMTVEHLTKMKNKRRNLTSNLSTHATPYVNPQHQFRQGYQQCMTEVARILLNSPVDETVAHRLVEHLSYRNPALTEGKATGSPVVVCGSSPSPRHHGNTPSRVLATPLINTMRSPTSFNLTPSPFPKCIDSPILNYPSPPNSPELKDTPKHLLSLPSVARRPIRPVPKVWRPW